MESEGRRLLRLCSTSTSAVFKESKSSTAAEEALTIVAAIKGKAHRHLEEKSQMNRGYIQESLGLNSELRFAVLVGSVCYVVFFNPALQHT